MKPRAHDRPADLDVRQARQQFGEEHAGFEPGQVGAQAEVSAVAERQMPVGLAGDVELVGTLEHRLVAVGRGEADQDLVAGADLAAAQLGIGRRGAPELDDRRREAQHLLDRRRQQRRVRHQLAALFGVSAQQQQSVRDQVAGRLVAGDHQQLEEAFELPAAQLLAVDLGIDDQAPDVAGRLRALLLRARRCVREHLEHAFAEGLRINARVRIVERDQRIGPLEQLVPVLCRHAEDVGQHQQRHFGRRLGQESTSPFSQIASTTSRACASIDACN
ncbi:MAG: hypothetical protein QM766_07340 [Burkholderiaceae bacterium]